ncbi:hypothetical protein Mpet_2310 [Methanolacinia petrolearia DSM 11571]|uniref:Uncharacterized protein n=1 Tax=Methanolacinia petrolearia (strain DSM 11571 / OCM 486 / SEBR 4847) TaxID=679926 RepID=E1RD74_METP4|nr:hypothetical protein [Methanolacinia petrolearia]ADN37057.1 hypothetical protein Mpet_2310 [Methanolacinia petrolearia DSM 11571]
MNDFDELLKKDITASVTVREDDEEPTRTGEDYKPESYTDNKGDHPFIALIDIGVNESATYCKKEGLPEPNLSLWENFSREFLNKALWHYAPDGDIPDSPILCLILGMGGLSACYIPVILAVIDKQKEEENKAKEKQETAPQIEEKPEPIRKIPEPETPKHNLTGLGAEITRNISEMEDRAKAFS